MYQDGLNLKGLLGGQLGSSESCHIKIYKSAQQTEIDFQGATNLSSSEGAQIFKSQLYKQTIEAFVSKYDYNQEWVGLEANISKSFAWGGLDQRNFYRLMYDNTNPVRGFLEILNGGYNTYAQLQIKDDKVNLYGQLGGTNYYFGIEATPQKIEEILYFADTLIKLKADNTEASTYNTYRGGEYATLVSKNGEDYIYLKGNGNGYSFLESKFGEARLWGSADGGQDYFDIRTQGGTYLQINNGQDYMYVAPKDIPTNSDPKKHYAGFNYFWYINDQGAPIKEAIIASDPIDIRHLGTCWAKYPCKPVLTGPPCFADLTFGGRSNQYCRLSAFDVYVGSGPEFELYQYQYGIDLKSKDNSRCKIAIYTDHSSSSNLDIVAPNFSQLSVNDSQARRYSQVFQDNSTNGFKLNRQQSICYMSADDSFRYLILSNSYGANWRTAAGNTTADTTVYTSDGGKQVYYGVNNSQAAIQFYANAGQNQCFGYANSTLVDLRLTQGSSAYAFMQATSSEGKVQVSKGGSYGYMASLGSVTDLEVKAAASSLYGKLVAGYNGEAKCQVSQGSSYSFILSSNSHSQAYIADGASQINIDTDDANGKYIYLREIDVCIDGEKKKMIILASDPY